jgi:hypothetical protein
LSLTLRSCRNHTTIGLALAPLTPLESRAFARASAFVHESPYLR